MNVHGIILAAGFSSRMGRTKALLDYHGETFVDRIRRILTPHCSEIFVVGAPGSSFAGVINPDPSRGMLSSLQCGLAALPGDSSGCFFTLVDLPAIQSDTIALLSRAAGPTRIVIPRFQGKNGHPVFLGHDLFEQFLSAHSNSTPKTIITNCSPSISHVDCDDAGTVRDADTPAQYQELISNV